MKIKKLYLSILFFTIFIVLSVITIANADKEYRIFELAKSYIGKQDTNPTTNDYKRVIADTTFPKDISDFQQKGCAVIHRLRDATALECPASIVPTLKNVREDKIFNLFDLEADVKINADDVWATGYNGSGVVVAILDTGVDGTHIELSDSILATKNFVKGSELDKNGHGTHVSGIVTANGVYTIDKPDDNRAPNKATGVAPGASIIVGKVCDNTFCFESDISAGIEWAVASGADVLSLSLGGGNFGSHCDSDTLAAKVNWAVSQGLVAVVAAGNDGAGVSSPACASGAIAVGAVSKSDVRPTWSNFGEALDLVAPGVDILSTYSCIAAGNCNFYWYAWMSGTSMSTPHVAGVAALILQKHPQYTVDNVKEALNKTALDLGATGWDIYYGWGRINALAAVNYASSPTQPIHDVAVTSILAPSSATKGDLVNINVSVKNEGNQPENFTVTVTDITDLITIGSQGVSLNAGLSSTIIFTWNTSTSSLGNHTIKAEASVVTGETDTADNIKTTVIIINAPDTTAPVISNVQVSSITETSATITWTTNEASDSVVRYGTLTPPTTTVFNPTLTTSHSIILSGLSASTTYYFEVQSTDVAGNTAVDNNGGLYYSFTTAAPPSNALHVGNILMSGEVSQRGKNKFCRASATVPILDQNNQLTKEASVSGHWSGAYSANVNGLTTGEGTVKFTTDWVKNCGTFTFTVDNVAKAGYVYNPSANVETSDSITLT